MLKFKNRIMKKSASSVRGTGQVLSATKESFYEQNKTKKHEKD